MRTLKIYLNVAITLMIHMRIYLPMSWSMTACELVLPEKNKVQRRRKYVNKRVQNKIELLLYLQL